MIVRLLLHTILCLLLLLSRLGFFVGVQPSQDVDTLNLSFSIEDESNLSGLNAYILKVKRAIQADLQKSLDKKRQNAKNQATYQQMQQHFMPVKINVDNDISEFDISAPSVKIHLNSSLVVSDVSNLFISSFTTYFVKDLYKIFEVYLI